MSSAWLLDQAHDVTVYERDERIGGHSNTVLVTNRRGGDTPVDTGFIVYNDRNYPNLTALFAHLDVPTKDSEMSFAASLGGGAVEYSGSDLNGLLGQRSNLFRPRFWRMMSDLLRFYRQAPAFLSQAGSDGVSLAEYLEAEGYREEFVEDHLLPMAAAIWSTTVAETRDYPAAAFIRFFESHGLLSIANRPQWRTVDGGSREYVQRLTAPYRNRIRLAGVRAVERRTDGVVIHDDKGAVDEFDHAVIAAHADEAYAMLSDPDPLEERLLGSWRYTRNRAVLHRDESLMPRRRRVWSSWNFIGDSGGGGSGSAGLCVTYWMNRLQTLDPTEPLFVTLNPVKEPAAGSIVGEFEYTHPFYDCAALSAQRELWSLQGRRRTWFCGSYFGYGFHEDALQSGLAVAEQLGGLRRPWHVEAENGRLHIPSGYRAAAE